VLDVGCGTGRVLLRLLEAGVDADGLDASEPMLERARARAAARGFRPALVHADMRDFTMPRRYGRAICAFNAFAHMETPDDQLRALRCIRDHLEPDGALVLHMSYPRPAYWEEPDGVPVLELEITRAENGHRVQMWDTRTKDAAAQRQHSRMEIRELDAGGRVVASHFSETEQRWVYRWELELLLRLAGYAHWEFFGGFAGEPFERADQPLVAWGWRS
jgi:SAM-dependent methyltransferase